MGANPWKVALVKLRRQLRDSSNASCGGRDTDLRHGWVQGHNEAFEEACRMADDVIIAALTEEAADRA